MAAAPGRLRLWRRWNSTDSRGRFFEWAMVDGIDEGERFVALLRRDTCRSLSPELPFRHNSTSDPFPDFPADGNLLSWCGCGTWWECRLGQCGHHRAEPNAIVCNK